MCISAPPGSLSRSISRNCHLREGIKGKRRRGRTRRQLIGELKEEKRYWNLKEGSTALGEELALGGGGAKDLWLDYKMLCGFGSATFVGQSFCDV